MRGKIYNEARAKQIRDFSGLNFGTITPTDVDGLLDFGNKLFVLIEAKKEGVELPGGQRLALERMCDAIHDSGKMSALLIVTHDTPADQPIDFAGCPVTECKLNGEWKTIKHSTTCRKAIEYLLKLAKLEY